MKKTMAFICCLAVVASAFFVSGCSKEFWRGGAAVETIGPDEGEKKQMERLEEDFKEGRIGCDEYLERKKEIKERRADY